MRVLITGCFDIIHPGHLKLFKEGAKLGEVYVIIARDATINQYKKSHPIIPEEQRLEVVRALKYVTYATLGNPSNQNSDFLKKALSLKPDIILLGPNQRISIEELKQKLMQHGAEHIQVKRLEELDTTFELNSSFKIKQKIKKTWNGNGNNH